MSIGHRYFVVDAHTAARLAQKTFNEFFFQHKPALPRYAGTTLVIAMVMYELRDRKPARVIRIDTYRFRVDSEGVIDREHIHEGMRLAFDRGFGGGRERRFEENDNVVDAKQIFDERRWKQHHPELPGPALKMILRDLFGARHGSQ